MEILIKYHNSALERIEKIAAGDWIDLRAAEDVTLHAGGVPHHFAGRFHAPARRL